MADRLIIKDCGKYHTVANIKKKGINHTHVTKERTAKMLCELVRDKKIPDSDYLRESCIRLTTDEKYIEEINIKREKDRQKPKYINVNKGVKQ